MRIQIVRKLTPPHIDTQSDPLQPGFRYEVDSTTAQLLIAEGWATLVVEKEPGLVVPLNSPSVKDAIAADIALDDAIAAAIERQTRP